LKKRNKEMTMSQGGSPSSATPKKTNKQMTTSLLARRHLLHLKREKNKKMTMSQGGSLLFTTFEKKNKSEKEAKKKKRLMYIYLPQMQWLSFGGVFSATPLQQRLLQRLLQHRFCNIASTLPLQHCFLSQHFNIALVAPSSVASLLLLSGDEV
jgi:hypothetical protein